MTYSLEPLSRDNADRWEAFNDRSPEGTIFHSLKWKQVLEEALQAKLKYYLILDGDDVVGISPWAEESTLNFRGLISIPDSDANNIVLDDGFDAPRFNDLLSLFTGDHAFLHFNTYRPDLFSGIAYANYPGGETGDMVVDLEKNPPETIWGTLSKKTKKSILRFPREGFELEVIDRKSDIGLFYHHYEKNMMHINGEILPLSFFETLWDHLSPGHLRIAVLAKGGTVAGGSAAFMDPGKKTVYFGYLALNRDLPHYTPTYYMDWDLINWARENGYEKVSLGRQRLDPGNPRFQDKAKLGAEHIPIHSRLVLFSKPTQILYRMKKLLPGRNA